MPKLNGTTLKITVTNILFFVLFSGFFSAPSGENQSLQAMKLLKPPSVPSTSAPSLSTEGPLSIEAFQDTENGQAQSLDKFQISQEKLSVKLVSKGVESVSSGEMVEYNGSIENIFFHPLIAYPEKSLDKNGKLREGIAEDFITVAEFVKLLNILYENNYILVDFKSLYDVSKENSKSILSKNKLKLPKDKKPFFFSIDDLNYYKYMRQIGTIHKLILDENQNIATLTVLKDGTKEIRYDNEIITVLEDFIKRHPDFSLPNARGIIALTGFEGIMGYRTDLVNSLEVEQEKNAVLPVIKKLKSLGWLFASHSYTHSYTSKMSYDRLVYDTEKWNREVGTLLGPTNLYIYPFGDTVTSKDPKFNYLLNYGFQMFFGVGRNPRPYEQKEFVQISRTNIDGRLFRHFFDKEFKMFNIKDVADASIRTFS